MAEILISLFVYINLVNDDNKKFIIINLLTKEINKISSKKFDYSYLYNEAEGYYDLDELYKEVDTSLKVQKKNKIKKSRISDEIHLFQRKHYEFYRFSDKILKIKGWNHGSIKKRKSRKSNDHHL